MNIKKFTLPMLFVLILWLSSPICQAENSSFVSVQPAFQTITLSGFTRARRSMPIASEISGKITHIYADIGDEIPKNGIFACLDNTFIKLDIAATENSIAQHGVDLKYLTKQVQRHKKLVKTRSAAISLLDDLIRQKELAYRAIQSAKIEKQKLKETKRRHCIKAPKGWVVTERSIEQGQWIDIGTPIAQANNYKQLLIPLTLTAMELDALQQKPKQFTIYLPEYKREVSATIERISPAFDEHSHKIRVDILVQDTSIQQRSGIRAELALDIPDQMNTFLIPKKALDERFEEVWLTRKNGKKIRVMLQGYLNDDIAKISASNIQIGDQFQLQHR
ncbi:MAG: efflux RND transporter periplasmic adaptor subunit [Methyloprofundus sp.]|nr:efflux RND transporter periplasmic adaptor subunit [Methyloprofundus sp.]